MIDLKARRNGFAVPAGFVRVGNDGAKMHFKLAIADIL